MMWFCREHDIEINKIISYHKERAGSDYFRNILSPLKESPPDIIYMVSYLKDGASLVKTIRELGIHSLLCGGAGGFTHSKFIAMAGEAADTLLTATLWFYQSNYSGTKEYYDRYIEKYSAPPDYHGAEAYSAIQTVADVLNRAKSFDPEGIRSALKNTDLVTPFGSVKFKDYGKFGNQNTLPTMVLQIRSNKFESIWPEELASSKFIPPSGWRNSPK
jgi:branched-chain amino acid transport system substrate-binding protein